MKVNATIHKLITVGCTNLKLMMIVDNASYNKNNTAVTNTFLMPCLLQTKVDMTLFRS